jgi:hypothetical protein
MVQIDPPPGLPWSLDVSAWQVVDGWARSDEFW